MNHRTLLGILAVSVAWSSLADPVVYTNNFSGGFNNGGIIPDGNVAGWSDTRSISGVVGDVADVNVWLNLSGGYNGDLYGYLVHDSGFAVLVNRVGRAEGVPFGYADAGMNLRFDDTAANGDIHFYQLVSGYNTSLFDGSSWSPDGRDENPATMNGSEARTSLLDDFIGLGGDGSWTLFLADLSVGEETTVISWGLEITAVPEPSTWVLMTLGLLSFAGLMRSRHCERK